MGGSTVLPDFAIQTRHRIYSKRIRMAQNTADTFEYRVDHDSYLIGISGAKNPIGYPLVRLRWPNEQSITTRLIPWPMVVGSGRRPFMWKVPLFWPAQKSLMIDVDTVNLLGDLDGTISVITVPVAEFKARPKPNLWSARTQLYASEPLTLGIAGTPASRGARSIVLDRAGYLWGMVGALESEYGSPWEWDFLVKYGLSQQAQIVSEFSHWGSVMGDAERPLWFKLGMPIGTHQAITFEFESLDMIYDIRVTVALIFCPTE